MPSIRQKNIVPSRRRRDDDDDEEGSVAADVEEDSLSEGSPISNGEDDADVEGSEVSEQEAYREPDVVPTVVSTNGVAVAAGQKDGEVKDEQSKPSMNVFPPNSADTNAMLNGLKTTGDADAVKEIQFEDTVVDMPASPLKPVQALSEGGRQETMAERSRREHQEYLKKRDENPAFVPNRGGFFLHDNRQAQPGMNGVRPFARGRGRGSFVNMHSS